MVESIFDYSVIKCLFSYLNEDKKKLFLFFLSTCICTGLSVVTPYFLAYTLDQVFRMETPNFLFLLFLLGVSYFLPIFLERITSVRMLEISENVLFKIRRDLFSHLIRQDIKTSSTYQKGDMITRFTSDVENISETLGEVVIECMRNLFLLLGSTFFMFHMHIKLSLIVLGTVPLFFIGAFGIASRCGKYEIKKQEKLGEVTSFFEEKGRGLSVLKAYHVEEGCISTFDSLNQELFTLQKKTGFLTNLILPLNTVVSNIGNITILFYGTYLVCSGVITVGVLFAFLSYANMFRSPIHELGSIFSDFSESCASLNRIFTLLSENVQKVEGEKGTSLDTIIFEHVFFTYDKKWVLKDISFQIKKGDKVAIVGPTGSGKTTLIQLLLGVYRPTNGQILIGNRNVNTYAKESLYENISILLQEPFLFNASIIENVLYGNPHCSREDGIKALKEVGADFVWKLEHKEYQNVGRNGKYLSEGEKQLLVIARTMLKNAELLILDEATSHVDLFTEKKVYEALLKLMKNKTVIMIAHRLRSIEKADTIFYLENGSVLEVGTHQELLLKKGKYYALYQSQFL